MRMPWFLAVVQLWCSTFAFRVAGANSTRPFGENLYSSAVPSAPFVLPSDFSTFPWSSGILRLSRRETLYLYHNYTVSASGTRFTYREVIPHYQQLIKRHVDIDEVRKIHARGFIVNSQATYDPGTPLSPLRHVSWSWKRPNPSCPAVIPLCFENDQAQSGLEKITDDALDMWREALGANPGVYFVYVGQDRCCKDDGGVWYPGVPNDVVVIKWTSDFSHTDYVGFKPGTERGRMGLEYNDFYTNDPAEDEVNMAHELGHILGLQHEHVRYDAPRWIRLETQNINNFDRFPDVVRDFNSKYHTNHQVDDLLHNLEVVERMWEFLNPLQIPLVGLVPYKQPTSPGGNGHEIIDYETEGELDFNSVMMYPSSVGSYDNIANAMVKVVDGTGWPLPKAISPGDVRAVKRLYPDNRT